MTDIETVAKILTLPGKGILASDESIGTIGKRLEKFGIENTEEIRRAYREIFYDNDMGSFLSGAIMFKDSIYQKTKGGKSFIQCLKEQKIIPGVKVDEGLIKLSDASEETLTKGLENLDENCKNYFNQGVRFTKWRAVYKIGNNIPSEKAIEQNACDLATYAKICQNNNLVPIVEPEILIDGSHSIEKFSEVSENVLQNCIKHLWKKAVVLEGCLIKPQMIINGSESREPKSKTEDIAIHTLRVLKRCIPAAIPGIMFLSGGQSEEEATINLNEINRLAINQGGVPWALSFSYGRALQASVLEIWTADQTKVKEAKSMAISLAKANSEATMGIYNGPHPSILAKGQNNNLKETFRGWSQT